MPISENRSVSPLSKDEDGPPLAGIVGLIGVVLIAMAIQSHHQAAWRQSMRERLEEKRGQKR